MNHKDEIQAVRFYLEGWMRLRARRVYMNFKLSDCRKKEKGAESAMEAIKEVAKVTYKNSMDEGQKKKMKELFNSIDKDGDGKISAEELKLYLEEKPGYRALGKSNIFSLIDENGDGFLQFDEFVSLYYVIMSDIPVCNACSKFTQGFYYVCLICLDKSGRENYNICISCYRDANFLHEHVDFLDNYSVFTDMREKLQEISTAGSSKAKSRKREKMKKAFKVLTGLSAIGSFLASCPW